MRSYRKKLQYQMLIEALLSRNPLCRCIRYLLSHFGRVKTPSFSWQLQHVTISRLVQRFKGKSSHKLTPGRGHICFIVLHCCVVSIGAVIFGLGGIFAVAAVTLLTKRSRPILHSKTVMIAIQGRERSIILCICADSAWLLAAIASFSC